MKSMLISGSILAFAPLGGFAEDIPKSEPAQLANLRSSWQLALSNATAPVNLKYREALLKMKKDLTRAGILEDALAVDAEIKALDASKASSKDKAPVGENPELHLIIGVWIFKNHEDGYEADFQLNADGTAILNKKIQAIWKVDGNKLVITFVNGTGIKENYDLPIRNGKLTGVNSSNQKVTITRKPSETRD